LTDLNDRKIFNAIAEFRASQGLPDSKTMVIVDKESNIFYSNAAFEGLFGLSAGSNLRDLDSDPNIVYLIEGIAKSNYPSLHFELFFSGSNNRTNGNYSVDIEKITIQDKNFFILIIASLEEKAKIEARINNLNDALEYGNVPVLITDGAGYITYCTKSFEEILNKGIEELYAAPLSDALAGYLSGYDLGELLESLKNAKKWRKRILKTDKNGGQAFKELLLNPVLKESDNTKNFILIANDITDLVLKNRIIKKSEERQKSIINNISDLLLIVKTENKNLLFENANENFCKVFTIQKDEVAKKNIAEIFATDFLSVLADSIYNLTENSLQTVEFQYSNGEIGKIYSGNISFTDDKFEDERIYIISLKDITQQILYERQLNTTIEKETQLNKLKTIFIENMSHELRTPYNALIGYSEILDDEIKDGNVESTVEIMSSLKEVFGRVLSLFSNIIEVSQIESHEISLNKVKLNCNKILLSIYEQNRELAESKNIVMELQPDASDFLIEVDWLKLEKIVEVLVDNAIKYTDHGTIILGTKVIGRKLEILISDTGIGMNEDEIEKLLEPFNQEEDVYTRTYQGIGLGLTIAYRLTKLMGGEFIINSRRNEGTEVRIIFPTCYE
jgi:PAS domain S-box-containing protein